MNSGAVAYENKARIRMAVAPAEKVYPEHMPHAVSKKGIIVAIPAYNEEVAVGSIVLRSLKYAEKVIVIDDGSKDRTSEIAKLAGADVIVHEANMGKGKGIKEAFEYACKHNAEVLVLIDGDGQHDPDEMPLLIEPILSDEADLVNGSRFIEKNGNSVPRYRRVGQEVLTVITNIGSRRKITDTQNGFRAFSRRAFNCFSFEHTNMAIESEMIIDAANAGMRIKEVQICVRYDVAGSTYNPVVHGLTVMASTIKLVTQRRQMLFFGTSGTLLLLAGIALVFLEISVADAAKSTSMIYATVGMFCIALGPVCIFSGMVLSYIQSMRSRNFQLLKQ